MLDSEEQSAQLRFRQGWSSRVLAMQVQADSDFGRNQNCWQLGTAGSEPGLRSLEIAAELVREQCRTDSADLDNDSVVDRIRSRELAQGRIDSVVGSCSQVRFRMLVELLEG